eukprot:TRINITY_DN66941_c1_g1_i1.p1 TRINITY_DN66941_c1_g1~~TRINITY_DN66941_c1_g1_i1.p1  ORF type:complete len:521 (-),score=52.85 TRINITY_DN66941_c1_g1_i1:1233-2795(-)
MDAELVKIRQELEQCEDGEISFANRESRIGDNGVIIVSEYIIANPRRIFSLDLSRNNIGPVGAAALSRVLQHTGCVLEELYLNGNPLKDEGVIALADGLSVNKCLETMHVRFIQTGDVGAKFLLSSLLDNYSVRHVDLVGNTVSDSLLQAINVALKKRIGENVKPNPIVQQFLLQSATCVGPSTAPPYCRYKDPVSVEDEQAAIVACKKRKLARKHNASKAEKDKKHTKDGDFDDINDISTSRKSSTSSHSHSPTHHAKYKPSNADITATTETASHCPTARSTLSKRSNRTNASMTPFKKSWKPNGAAPPPVIVYNHQFEGTPKRDVGLTVSPEHVQAIVERLHGAERRKCAAQAAVRALAELEKRKKPLRGEKLKGFLERNVSRFVAKKLEATKKTNEEIEKLVQRQKTLNCKTGVPRVEVKPWTAKEQAIAKRFIEKPLNKNDAEMNKLQKKYHHENAPITRYSRLQKPPMTPDECSDVIYRLTEHAALVKKAEIKRVQKKCGFVETIKSVRGVNKTI